MQFTVPQFIEVEAKIIGPISARQFIILLVVLGLDFVLYKIFPPVLFIPTIILATLFAIVVGFAHINGQAMHYFLLNLIQTLRRPRLRVWSRTEYKEREEEEDVAPAKVYTPKAQATESRLAAISLMVDTGGVYATDDVRQPGASATVGGQKAVSAAVEEKNMNLK